MARIDQPVDLGLRPGTTHRRRGGKRVDDVAERSESDDENAVHNRATVEVARAARSWSAVSDPPR